MINMTGKFHFYFGIAIVILFTLTGQYMHHSYNHLQDMEQMNRALFRAGHLYILLFGLINVGIGTYYSPMTKQHLRVIQILSSVVIIGATLLVLYGFFTELPTEEIERPLTRISLYLILAGVAVQGIASRFDTQ